VKRNWLVVLASAVGLALATAEPSPAAVTARFSSAFPMGQGTLRVASDTSDAITLTCSDGFVVVNGDAPDTGPVRCSLANAIQVIGGPGDNVIAVSGSLPAGTFGVFRGASGLTSIQGGAGDDVVIGPTNGFARLEGGPGDDVLEGRTLDRYLFGPAETPELDTIVESPQTSCSPSFFDSNQPGLTYWTVPWDAADFTELAASDPVTLAAASPAGIFAIHRNRTIRLDRPGSVSIEAVAGGAGNDILAGACMTLGGPGDDRLAGSREGDLILGGPGNDELEGRDGPDTLNGGSGEDRLHGGQGDDALAGMHGNDSSFGGAGGDIYLFEPTGGSEAERVTEERTSGVDVLSFALPADSSMTASLGARGDVVASARGLIVRTEAGGAAQIEGVIGGAGPDRLIGSAGANHFWSGGGIDLVAGGPGNDTYHVDWAASMPYGAYGFWEEPWGGPFDRGVQPRRSLYDQESETPRASVLRLAEPRAGGIDALDLAESWMVSPGSASRLQGHLRGARVDLSAARQIMRTRWIQVVAARQRAGANLERVRGTSYQDVLIGNSAANVLEGRHSRDLVIGRGGSDTCLTYRREDVLRGCEHVRPRDPDR
jgi:Ca2+-binding RTX toxin-like protein